MTPSSSFDMSRLPAKHQHSSTLSSALVCLSISCLSLSSWLSLSNGQCLRSQTIRQRNAVCVESFRSCQHLLSVLSIRGSTVLIYQQLRMQVLSLVFVTGCFSPWPPSVSIVISLVSTAASAAQLRLKSRCHLPQSLRIDLK